MQCDYCTSTATIFYTKIVDGQSTKFSFCAKCAAEQGVTDPNGFSIGHIQPISQEFKQTPLSLPEDQLFDEDISLIPDSTASCPRCGFDFDDLKKTGRLGCSQCYQFFRDEIKQSLAGMHVGVSHHGRVPKGMLKAFQHRQELEKLQLAMDEAIKNEDYEQAATLRDQIAQLDSPKALH